MLPNSFDICKSSVFPPKYPYAVTSVYIEIIHLVRLPVNAGNTVCVNNSPKKVRQFFTAGLFNLKQKTAQTITMLCAAHHILSCVIPSEDMVNCLLLPANRDGYIPLLLLSRYHTLS